MAKLGARMTDLTDENENFYSFRESIINQLKTKRDNLLNSQTDLNNIKLDNKKKHRTNSHLPRRYYMLSSSGIIITFSFFYFNYLSRKFLSVSFSFDQYYYFIIIFIIILNLFFVIIAIINYLKIQDLNSYLRIDNEEIENDILTLQRQIDRLDDEINRIELGNKTEPQPKDESEAKDGSMLFNGILNSSPNIDIVSAKQELISIRQSIVIDDLLADCRETRTRLLNEIDSLKSRGTLNLSFGAGTTVFGVIILASMFFSDQKFDSKLLFSAENLHYYLSRITTIIFIEVFAFFFLRLYRNSLADIKYFQNELTNIEAKFLSLKSALFLDNIDLRKEVVQAILKTERNEIVTAEKTNLIYSTLKADSDKDRLFIDGFKSAAETLGNLYEKKEKPAPSRNSPRKSSISKTTK